MAARIGRVRGHDRGRPLGNTKVLEEMGVKGTSVSHGNRQRKRPRSWGHK